MSGKLINLRKIFEKLQYFSLFLCGGFFLLLFCVNFAPYFIIFLIAFPTSLINLKCMSASVDVKVYFAGSSIPLDSHRVKTVCLHLFPQGDHLHVLDKNYTCPTVTSLNLNPDIQVMKIYGKIC